MYVRVRARMFCVNIQVQKSGRPPAEPKKEFDEARLSWHGRRFSVVNLQERVQP